MIDLKAILYTIAWGLLALSLGDVAEHYLGWESARVSQTIMVMVLVSIWSDLNETREKLARIRSKAQAVVDAQARR